MLRKRKKINKSQQSLVVLQLFMWLGTQRICKDKIVCKIISIFSNYEMDKVLENVLAAVKIKQQRLFQK